MSLSAHARLSVLQDNLRELGRERDRQRLRRAYHLRDAARLFCEEFSDAIGENADPSAVLQSLCDRTRLIFEELSSPAFSVCEDGKTFCSYVCEKMGEEILLAIFAALPHVPSAGTVALIDHPSLRAAFAGLISVNLSFTPDYVSDFREACEDVAEGNAVMCLLPHNDPGGGAMPYVEALARRYHLVLIGETEKDGVISGMYSTGFLPLREGPVRLFVRYLFDGEEVPGVTVFQNETVLSVRSDRTDGVSSLCVSYREDDRRSLTERLLFLTLFFPDARLTALYSPEE